MRPVVLALALVLFVAAPTAMAQAEGCTSHEMSYSQVCQSALTGSSAQARDGSRIELWTFQGTASECVDIGMQSSDFIAYLQLIQGSRTGPVIVEGADQVRARLPRTSTYYIKATSSGRGDQQGMYTLSLNAC